MNGIEKITARIEAEAVADAARVSEETAARCEALRAEGEAKAQESYWRRVREGVEAAEDRVDRLSKAANMESRKSILSCKQTIVGDAFQRAEKKLLALSGEPCVAFLAGQAARASVTGREELVLKDADRAEYGAQVVSRANALLKEQGKPAGLTLSEEAGDFSGGLVLRDGNISLNCTVSALVSEARQAMASEVAAALFE